MSRGTRLLKNTGILLIAKISTQIVNFLLLPIYTAVLTKEEYGEIDIYSSLSMIIIPFLSLQLEMGLFRYYIVGKEKKHKKEIVTTVFFIYGIILGMSSIVYYIVIDYFRIKYSLLTLCYYIFLSVSAVLLQVCRAQGNNIAYGIASFMGTTFTVLLNILFVVGLERSVDGVLMASVIAHILSSVYMIIKTKVYTEIELNLFSIVKARELLGYSFPLVFNQISSWIINYSDRIIILNIWGIGVNGIYSLANKFSSILGTFFGVYNVAWTENVVRSMDDQDATESISYFFEVSMCSYLLLTTGVINILPFVFSLLVNNSYMEAYCHVPILLVAMCFSGMAANVGSIYIAYGKTKEVSITTCLSGICNICVHMLLLESLELYAASISTLISFGALLIYRMIFVKKFCILQINMRKIWIQIGMLILTSVVYELRNDVLVWGMIAINLGCAFYICRNYNLIPFIFKVLKRKKV